jgi:hypothetical protein
MLQTSNYYIPNMLLLLNKKIIKKAYLKLI